MKYNQKICRYTFKKLEYACTEEMTDRMAEAEWMIGLDIFYILNILKFLFKIFCNTNVYFVICISAEHIKVL